MVRLINFLTNIIMNLGLVNVNNEINFDGPIHIDVFKCDGCIPRTVQENVSIILGHDKAVHTDFGAGMNGWLVGGQCSLGDECVCQDTRTLNRGCSICKAIIHEGECMRIHKNQELNKEKIQWMKSNIEIVAKHYKSLRRRGVLTDEAYVECIDKLQKYVM